jgi:hypothetical protein
VGLRRTVATDTCDDQRLRFCSQSFESRSAVNLHAPARHPSQGTSRFSLNLILLDLLTMNVVLVGVFKMNRFN